MFAEIQISHRAGATARRVNRESARETERVQHVSSSRQALHSTPIFALIQKKPRLLSAQHVRLESYSRFPENDRSSRWVSAQDLAISQAEIPRPHRLDITAEPQHQSL